MSKLVLLFMAKFFIIKYKKILKKVIDMKITKKALVAILLGSVASVLLFSACNESNNTSSTVVSSQIVESSTETSFDEYFAQNPIDKDYDSLSQETFDNIGMVSLEADFLNVWKKEAEQAYVKLLDLLPDEEESALEKEQQEWRIDIEKQQEALSTTDSDEGGSMRNLSINVQIKDLYKERAKALYERIYQYDKNFAYFYESIEEAKG